MNAINLTLPASWNCKVSGVLYESDDVSELSEDMLEIAVPGGVLVCAGWFDDIRGQAGYMVSAIKGIDDVIQPIVEPNAQDAISVIREVVESLRPGNSFSPTLGATDTITSSKYVQAA
jgi:hypothetical protein